MISHVTVVTYSHLLIATAIIERHNLVILIGISIYDLPLGIINMKVLALNSPSRSLVVRLCSICMYLWSAIPYG